MTAGTVVRFDEMRGYGFASTDDSDEDVFVHVNDFLFVKQNLAIGTRVEFDIEQGDRGLKASSIRLLDEPNAESPAQPGAAEPSTARRAANAARDGDEGGDVLGRRELEAEVTESLLTTVPELTARQIVTIRRAVVELAGAHGWVD